MILPIANIVVGFLLSAPKLKEWFLKQNIESAEASLNKYRTPIGVIILILGIVGFLKRMSWAGIMYEWSWNYGSSFPQSIIAIIMGLVLCANFFSKWSSIHSRVVAMSRHSEWIGIVGIVIGAGSLI